MKLGFATLFQSVLMLSASSVLGETTTAVGAFRALERDRGEAFCANVVQVIGVGGGDQPPVWRIITKDPYQSGAIRDFAVENGRVVGDQFVPPAYHSRIPEHVLREEKLGLDSTGVFLIANERAKRAKVGFYTLDYEMRFMESGGGLWIVRLNGADRGRVGELIIRSANGAVVRERWWQPKPALAEPVIRAEGSQSESESESIGDQIAGRWHMAKRGLSDGSAGIKKNAEHAGKSVRSFFREVFASEESEEGKGAKRGAQTGFGYLSEGAETATADGGRYH